MCKTNNVPFLAITLSEENFSPFFTTLPSEASSLETRKKLPKEERNLSMRRRLYHPRKIWKEKRMSTAALHIKDNKYTI